MDGSYRRPLQKRSRRKTTKAFEIILPEIQRTTQKSEVKPRKKPQRSGARVSSDKQAQEGTIESQISSLENMGQDTRLKKILFLQGRGTAGLP
ncbi:MAG: hypothetical protein IPK04_12975 [Bdellovibrionales bacterium]|nr:hypothetical protein [Bdellovibrionales bacterium]